MEYKKELHFLLSRVGVEVLPTRMKQGSNL